MGAGRKTAVSFAVEAAPLFTGSETIQPLYRVIRVIT